MTDGIDFEALGRAVSLILPIRPLHKDVGRAVFAALEAQGFVVARREDLDVWINGGNMPRMIAAGEALIAALAAPPVGAGEEPTPCDHRGRWIQRPEDSHDGRGATICPTCHGRWPLYPEPAP